MTILEELIDLALKSCEKSRAAGQKYHQIRGCALLTSSGKVYFYQPQYQSDFKINLYFVGLFWM